MKAITELRHDKVLEDQETAMFFATVEELRSGDQLKMDLPYKVRPDTQCYW